MFDSNKDLSDFLRNQDKNIALILEYLAKNAPTFSTTPWETSSTKQAIDLLIFTIDQQNEKVGRLDDLLIKWITANFKANELVQNNLNSIVTTQDKLSTSISELSQSVKELSIVVKNQNEFNAKSKALLEFLVTAIPSETIEKKTSKNPKLDEIVA